MDVSFLPHTLHWHKGAIRHTCAFNPEEVEECGLESPSNLTMKQQMVDSFPTLVHLVAIHHLTSFSNLKTGLKAEGFVDKVKKWWLIYATMDP